MIQTASVPVDVDREALLAALHDQSSWNTWLEGVELTVDGDAVRIEVGGPRPFGVHLDVRPISTGVEWELVQGELSAFEGRIVIDGESLSWEHELQLPLMLPPHLRLEIEREVLPRWLGALQQRVRHG